MEVFFIFLSCKKKNKPNQNQKNCKMRISFLLCVFHLVSAQVAKAVTTAHYRRHAASEASKMQHLLHAEPVATVRLSPLPPPKAAPGHHVGTRRLLHEVDDESEAELHAPFGRRLALNFEALGKNHSVVLNLHDALFEEGSMSRYTDDEGLEVVEIPRAVAYTGTLMDGGWIRATIYDDDVIRAMWLDKSRGVVNMLTPVSFYENMAPSVAASARAMGGKMLAFRLNDMDHSDEDRRLLESWLGIPMNFQQQMPSVLRNGLRNSSAPYGLMSGCPSTMQRVPVGFAVDTGYTKHVTGLGTTAITNLVAVRRINADIQFQLNVINSMYVDMANVFLVLAESIVKTRIGGEIWNEEPLNPSLMLSSTNEEVDRRVIGCLVSRTFQGNNGDDEVLTLQNIGAWRATLPVTRRYAIWHLFTKCYNTLNGIAYLGTTCSAGTSGVGWTRNWGDYTMMTVAHEIGHNFNAAHTIGEGGIMSYDSPVGRELAFRGDNPTQICSHVNAVRGVCYGVMTPRCGNGVIEPGEDCDDTTPCCNSATCKLAVGAKCTPGISPDCCTSGCNFRPTYVACSVPSGIIPGLGYCVNGHCRANIRGIPCNATEANPCMEHGRSTSGGACTGTLMDRKMPNGAVCNAALDKECLDGLCVTPAAPLEVPATDRAMQDLEQDSGVYVDNPKQDEVLYVGTLAIIQWTDSVSDSDSDSDSVVTITLSDGTVILERGRTRGKYVWNVQAAPGTHYTVTVRVQNSTHAMTGISSMFAIQEKPAVVLTLPVEDAVVRQGEATTIAWTNVGGAALSEIFLSIQDAESLLETSLGTPPNTGEFVWVPSSTLPSGLFRIVLQYSPPTRAGNVTILGPVFQLQPSENETIAFLSPSGNNILEVGKTHRIVWTSPACLVSAALYLVQPWNNFRKLLTEGVDENAFDWKVDHIGTGFQLEVYDATADGRRVMNATSEPFSISAPQPFVRITEILDGQDGALWVRGRNATVVVEASDPSDTLRLEIRDQHGALIYVVMTGAQPASGFLQIPIPFTVPPPDFSACFLVAFSNTYPGVSHTFPTPFSIVSQGHNDLPGARSSLQLIEPVDNAALIPGSNVNITWEGVMISSVTILLFHNASGKTTVVATVANTGVFEWTVPLVLGEYTLTLTAKGNDRVRTTPYIIRVVKGDESKRPSLAVVADLPPTISVGDGVNVQYASSGDVGKVTVELWSDAGLLSQITDNAPTNGSYRFGFEYVGIPADKAFLVLSSASGARAESSRFSILPPQHLSDVSVGGGGDTVYKGMPFNVTWHSAGVPFPVTVLLYHGTPDQRRTVSDQPCVPWKDGGVTHEGCLLSPDLRSDMCATEVDDNGRWIVGGRCEPLSATYRLISVLHTGVSTDNLARIELPAAETELPAAETELPAAETGYTVVVASTTSLQMEARSAVFAIDMPMVELTFPILLTSTERAGTSRAGVLPVLQEILTSVLHIDSSRLDVDVTGAGVHDLVRVMIHPTTSVVQAAALEVARSFVTQWSDPTSALNEDAKKAALFVLDTTGGDPTISFVVEKEENVGAKGIARHGVIVAGIILGMLALLAFVFFVATKA